MTVKEFLLRFFTWWNGATLNTLARTARHGELVGEDEYGNRYYRTKGGRIDPALGFELVPLAQLYRASDVSRVHLRLSDQTRGPDGARVRWARGFDPS